ncbi:type-2 ice-structuring protein-like isoform X4 [Notolabrus celidotus]|uniref:type-2 ice-structuring protein-like isoform X4 n=1 Tax=Notolabrus celidotus TaxID=1203425 RepID=UPI00148FC745|nr:type-2 ice-structuring protein-like isoform X4 [Notolabrus celidotus]
MKQLQYPNTGKLKLHPEEEEEEEEEEKAHLINFTMKILAVSALLCAMMALTTAAAVPEEEPEVEEAEGLQVVKRSSLQGWSQIGNRYFRYVTRAMTWAEAERHCISLGGHLASVHSFSEYNQIRAQITPSHDPKAWLGGTDIQMEGVWRWSDGSNLYFSFWCSGEPNNGGNQDCLQMSFTEHNCWDDLQCDHRLPSVCSRNK